MNESLYFGRYRGLSLPGARAWEKLRYISYVVDVCGGDGKLAAKVLGIHRNHFSQYVMWCVRRLRREGYPVPCYPRFAKANGGSRICRPVQEKRFNRLVPLRQHLHRWEERYITAAIRAAGGNKQAASKLLGCKKGTLSTLIWRNHPRILDPKPKHIRTREDLPRLWRAMMTLMRVMMACTMMGVPLPLVPVAARREEIETRI